MTAAPESHNDNTTTSSSSSTTVSRTGKSCPLCGAPGLKVCAGCSKVGYCSKEHQREDWKNHKLVCAQKHKLLQQPANNSSSVTSAREEVSVTWSDQQRINQFSRLNTQLSSLDDELKTCERDYINLVDACESLEVLIDDDAAMIKIGEVFISVSNEEAEEWAEKKKEEKTKEKEELLKQKEEIEIKMKELKTVLYGKFGKAINLENAEQTVNE